MAYHLPVVKLGLGTTLLVAFGVGGLYVLFLLLYRIYFHPFSKYPGPTAAKITRWYRFYHNVIRGGRLLHEIEKYHMSYGPVIRISPDELHFSGAKAYHAIYNDRANATTKDPAFYHLFMSPKALVGTVDPAYHRIRRELLNPLFSKQAIMRFESHLQRHMTNFLDRMEEFSEDKRSFDIMRAAKCFTVDIISEYEFGESFNALKTPDFNPPFIIALETNIRQCLFFEFFGHLQEFLIRLPESVIRIMAPDAIGAIEIQKMTYKHIFQRKEGIKGEAAKKEAEFNTILDTILHPAPSKGYMAVDPDDTLAQILFEILGAGTEESGNAMGFATFLILKTEGVLERLRNELEKAFPGNSEMPLNKLDQLPYLNGVVKEALRLSHGVPGRLPRISPPGGMRIGDVFVPSGYVVSCSSYMIHTSPEHFPEPNKLVPERWLGEEGKKLEKYMLPFSKGPRSCIGQVLAEAEVKVFIARFFRDFEVTIHYTGGDELVWVDSFTPVLGGELTTAVAKRE